MCTLLSKSVYLYASELMRSKSYRINKNVVLHAVMNLFNVLKVVYLLISYLNYLFTRRYVCTSIYQSIYLFNCLLSISSYNVHTAGLAILSTGQTIEECRGCFNFRSGLAEIMTIKNLREMGDDKITAEFVWTLSWNFVGSLRNIRIYLMK